MMQSKCLLIRHWVRKSYTFQTLAFFCLKANSILSAMNLPAIVELRFGFIRFSNSNALQSCF